MIAQDDIILKSDGDEIYGKVVKINEDDLQFVYKNESVEYTISKLEIIKITFSSGRIEFFNKELITSNFFDKNALDSNLKLENHHNRVAVLPFGYIKDQEETNIVMTKKIQKEMFAIFKKNTEILKFQNPEMTNTLLLNAGLKNNNIEGYTMGEICNVLDVEYVIQGLVSIEKPAMTNFSNEGYLVNKAFVDNRGHIVGDISIDNKETSNDNAPKAATQNYSTNISINVFNNKGDNVFSKDHASFWQTQDAYKITLTYLAKQIPLFKR